jgi:hypothetical protein
LVLDVNFSMYQAAASRRLVLENLSKQMGLAFAQEERNFTVWKLSAGKGPAGTGRPSTGP